MKKILGIVFLGLLLSGSAYAKTILNCQSDEFEFHKNGKYERSKNFKKDEIFFKIDASQNKIYEMHGFSNDFKEVEEYVNISSSKITWSRDDDILLTQNYYSINRITGDYIFEVYYDKKSPLRKENGMDYSKITYKCILDKKLF